MTDESRDDLKTGLDCTIPRSAFTISSVPVPKGYWVLYKGDPIQTKFAMYRKPTPEQVKNTEELLGWGWEDNVSTLLGESK